jgi:lipopolysaccharide/colanic/teichoic acid biosynthesis glycosyltransferase
MENQAEIPRSLTPDLDINDQRTSNPCVLLADNLSENPLSLVVDRYARLDSKIAWHQARFQLKGLVRTIAIASDDIGKRLVDLVGAIILLIVLSPLFLLIAVLIKLDSDGPVFFRQIRVGKWGKHFTMLKFRSMTCDAEHRKAELVDQNEMRGGVIFKMKRDPRVTRIGRIVRRSSLDELPQLCNVLRGEMSLVGPRPPVPTEVDMYSLGERRRLDAKPGITCVWQVSGRSQLPFRQQVDLDVAYIETQSLWGDVKLLMKTIPAVLTGRGAY